MSSSMTATAPATWDSADNASGCPGTMGAANGRMSSAVDGISAAIHAATLRMTGSQFWAPSRWLTAVQKCLCLGSSNQQTSQQEAHRRDEEQPKAFSLRKDGLSGHDRHRLHEHPAGDVVEKP